MKKLILFFLVLLPFRLLAQTDQIPLRRTNQVIVKTDVPAKEGYQLIVMALKENGYILDQKDEILFTAKTKDKSVEKGDINYFLTVMAKYNEVIISGKSKLNRERELGNTTPSSQYSDIEYANNPYSKTLFSPLTKVAKALNKPIIYNKPIKTRNLQNLKEG